MEEREYSKFVYLAVFLVLGFLSYLIIEEFIMPIIGGALAGYIFYPIYKKIEKHTKHKWLASITVTLLIVFLITIPFIFLFNIIVKDVYANYFVLKQHFENGLPATYCFDNTFGCRIANTVSSYVENIEITEFLHVALNKGTTYLVERSSNFISKIPGRVLHLFIFMIVLYYTLKDGKFVIEKFKNAVPLRSLHQTQIFKKIDDMIYSIVYGNVIVSIIQGAIATLGYFVFGLTSPIVWGIITAFFALIPMGGTALVWVPASLYLILNGIIYGTNDLGKGIGLAIYSVLVVSTIDNFIKPHVIGERANLHPALVVLGVFGGIAVFGMLGVFLGPIILGLFVTFIDIYKDERNHKPA